MNEGRSISATPVAGSLALAGLIMLFLVVALRYAAKQSVWTDESTQLSGLTLGFLDQLRWLAGRLPHAFAVPADRTPPLSYWLGSVWARMFGERVPTMRYLSIGFSVASVFAVWTIARQFFGRWPALICAALLALSPNFLVEAAEIRAYAAFIFFTTLLISSYLKLLAARPTPSALDLWSFTIAAVLCSYTHFFGIPISVGALLCLLGYYFRCGSREVALQTARKAKWPALFYLISTVALIPFIFAAANLSGGGEVSGTAVPLAFTDRIHDLVKLAYRLFGHQSMLGIPGLSAAALVAGVILIAFAAVPGCARGATQLLVLLLVNLALIGIAGLKMSAFNAFSASYNAWALPVTAMLAGGALVHRDRRVRGISILCVSVLIVAYGYTSWRFATSGELYGHTRSTVIKSAVDGAGPNNVILLYVNDAPSLYFALTYDYGGFLRQYIAQGDMARPVGSRMGSRSARLCELAATTLLIAGDAQLPAKALQDHIADPDSHTQAFAELGHFLDLHKAELMSRWTLVSRNEFMAQSALALAVLRRRPAEQTAHSDNCGVP